MKTTLEIVCNVFGWQGGTIHQVIEEYKKISLGEKDKVCNALMRALDKKELTDLSQASIFFKARLS